MDNNTYNLITAIMFVILTSVAIFIPLFFSIKASNRTDDKLNEFIKIISGIDLQTKNILNEIKNSTKRDVEKTILDFKEEIKPLLRTDIDLPRIDALAQNKIIGLTGSIDTNLNNLPFSGSLPRFLGSKRLDKLLAASDTDEEKEKEK